MKNSNSSTFELLLFIVLFTLILLHILGGLFSSYYVWGIGYWFVLGTYTIPLGIAALTILTLIYLSRNYIQKKVEKSSHKVNRNRSVYFTILSFIIIFIILYIFRVKSLVYGDGYLISGNLLDLEQILSEGKSYLEILTIYLYYYSVLIFTTVTEQDGVTIIAVLNTFAGALSLFALWSISGLLSNSRATKLFLFVSTLTSSIVILFFGYIEYYPWAVMCSLWGIRYLVGYVKEENGIIPMLVFSLFALLFHFLSFPLLAVCVYVIIYRSTSIKIISQLSLKKITILIIAGLLIVYITEQFTIGSIFVSVWYRLNNVYVIFSKNHILDIFNHLLLVAPLILFIVPVLMKKEKQQSTATDINFRVLYLLTIISFLMAFIIDPELGAVRDWDVLAFYAIPCTLLMAYLILRKFESKKFPVWLTFAVGLLAIVHILPNIYEKNNPNSAVLFLDTVLWEDPHYQSNYKNANRGISWGYLLWKSENRPDLAKKYFTRSAKVVESNASPCYNLAMLYYEDNKLDSARYYLKQGHIITPDDPKYLTQISDIENKEKNFLLAKQFAEEALKIDSMHIPAISNLGIAAINLGLFDEAGTAFRKAYSLNPNTFNQINNMALFHMQTRSIDSSIVYLKESLPFATKQMSEVIYINLITVYSVTNDKTNALLYFDSLQVKYPNSRYINQIQELLKQSF